MNGYSLKENNGYSLIWDVFIINRSEGTQKSGMGGLTVVKVLGLNPLSAQENV